MSKEVAWLPDTATLSLDWPGGGLYTWAEAGQGTAAGTDQDQNQGYVCAQTGAARGDCVPVGVTGSVIGENEYGSDGTTCCCFSLSSGSLPGQTHSS